MHPAQPGPTGATWRRVPAFGHGQNRLDRGKGKHVEAKEARHNQRRGGQHRWVKRQPDTSRNHAGEYRDDPKAGWRGGMFRETILQSICMRLVHWSYWQR